MTDNRFHIDAMGAQGDGLAHMNGAAVFIPFTLPGEDVTASRDGSRADLLAVLRASEARIEPSCTHFGTCGSCALQHWDEASYLAWKRDKVVDALRGQRITCEVTPILPSAPGMRRRATYALRRTESGMLLGYYEALSHRIVDIVEDPIMLPSIVARFADLRALATLICATGDAFRMTVTQTDSGLDIAIAGAGKPTPEQRLRASDFAVRNRLARVSLDGEIIVEPAKPTVSFGGTAVILPPGGFLQASEPTEQAMAALVTGHLKRAKKVVDLFSGAGTFSLPLARGADVHAVESDTPALAALDRGFRFGSGLRRVTTEKRDLFRRPLTFKELALYDGLVFDPPRAGAEDQAKQIARSTVPFVAAVSCNPVTLARDLAILLAGGYTLRSVTPIDQFLWSPHVEAVALLEKPRKRR
ncbi:MAG TPA: class I SAM-dependent RNA methyltransferase [Rhizobiaceae bacterium]|nr:class I SAM-dependent RNA methyltransferase [Rhizobiaceae bacterium]